MSCQKKYRKISLGAVQSGVPAPASRVAAIAGQRLANVGGTFATALKNELRGRRASVVLRPERPLPVLSGSEQVTPLDPNELKEKLCVKCKTSSETKKGNWYRLGSKVYCQDCAPAQAGKAGISLSKTASNHDQMLDLPALSIHWPRKNTTLKPRTVTTGAVNMAGYAVMVRGKESGLSLTPEVKTNRGQIQVDTKRWFVHSDRANKAVTGPYPSAEAAQGMAGLLVNLNWQREIADFSKQEVGAVREMVRYYRDKNGYSV